MKEKEIKFRNIGRHFLQGRQNNILYQIYLRHCDKDTLTYAVSIRDLKNPSQNISTQNRQKFTLEDAKRFCQDVAAGRVDLKALRREYDQLNQAMKMRAEEKARQEADTFRNSLSDAGITFTAFLELMEQFDQLDSMARSFLEE